jgi:integrase
MASVTRQPLTRYWIATFRDAQGKQHRRSTKETSKTRALEVARQFERVAKGKGNAHKIRNTFAEFYREHYGVDLPFSNVRSHCENWLSGHKAEISESTFSSYRKSIERLLEYLGDDAGKDLTDISKPRIAGFRDFLLARYRTRSANQYLKIVRMIFRAARLDGYLWQDPAEGIKSVKTKEPFVRRPFTLDELRSILAVADSEWQTLIRFGLYTGQRLSDLANLTWSQIDLDRDEIRLVTRKTGKNLLIPIAASLRDHLLVLANVGDNPRDPVHPRSYRIFHNRKGSVAVLSNQFSEILIAAGLRPPRTRQGKGIRRDGKRTMMDLSFHSLRHTAVSLLKDAGIPDAVVMALVGHESTAMSQRYTHVGKEALTKATRSLPEI